MASSVRFYQLLRRISATPSYSSLLTSQSAFKFASYAVDHRQTCLWAGKAFRASLFNAVSRQYRASSGMKLVAGSMCGIPIGFALVSAQPHVSYAFNGLDIMADDPSNMASSGLDSGSDSNCVPPLVRRFWLPLLLLLRVFWTLDSPITLIMTVTTLLLSTKPRPFSVYVVIDKLCHQHELQEPQKISEISPFMDQPVYARKVEVEDYMVACLARVQIKDNEFTFIGILGSWWELQLSHFPYVLAPVPFC